MAVAVNRRINPEGNVAFTLRCWEICSKGESKSQTELHNETVEVTRVECEFAASHSSMPVTFALPADARPRSDTARGSVRWSLQVKAETPGVDFSVLFDDLPVYAVKDPSQVQKGSLRNAS